MNRSRVLQVQDLRFSYDQKPILKGINLEVSEGEFISIIGPNGAGKSTLIKCINRILTGWTGQITLFGQPLQKLRQRQLASLVGYVPQTSSLASGFSVEEFVLMGRYPWLSPFSAVTPQDKEAVRASLALTGVDHLAHRQLDSLSGGERQSAAISAALCQGARVLLLDEPTAALDYRHQADTLTLLKTLNRDQGVTILAVTHDLNHASQVSDRVIGLKSGEICHSSHPEDLIESGALEALYGISFSAYVSPQTGARLFAPGAD